MKFYADEWELFLTHCDFTDDEKAVIALIRRGWYGVDIAEELNMSHKTEKRRVRSISNKIKRYLLKS